MTIFGSGSNEKGIRVRYLIVNASSPYKVIIRRPTFNALEVVFSTLYLTMKYSLEGGHVGIVKDDQGLSRKCYKDSLKLKKKIQQEPPMLKDSLKVNLVDLDPREDTTGDNLTLIG